MNRQAKAKPSRQPGLEPDAVVRAALDLLDRVGLEQLSMRRLAEALGVQNPALYWHFRDKQEISDRMAQVLLAEGFAALDAPPAPASSEERLRGLARAFRAAMLARRDGARLIASADLSRGDELLRPLDRGVTMLVEDGFRAKEALGAILTLIHYTLGATFEEQADPRLESPKLSKARAKQLPALAGLVAKMGEAPAINGDERFELGIALILDGLRARRPALIR